MTTQKISAPVALAVSMARAKEMLRIEQDDTSLDGSIELWINGITAEAEHQTGRAFINRAMRRTQDRFSDAIQLSAPVFSVEAISFLDPDGNTQILDPDDYYVDKVTVPGYIVPARGKMWPATQARINAVTIDYTAGYGATEADVPVEARNYVLAKLQVQFESSAGAGASVSKPFNVEYLDRLLDGLRVYEA